MSSLLSRAKKLLSASRYGQAKYFIDFSLDEKSDKRLCQELEDGDHYEESGYLILIRYYE